MPGGPHSSLLGLLRLLRCRKSARFLIGHFLPSSFVHFVTFCSKIHCPSTPHRQPVHHFMSRPCHGFVTTSTQRKPLILLICHHVTTSRRGAGGKVPGRSWKVPMTSRRRRAIAERAARSVRRTTIGRLHASIARVADSSR